MVGFPAGMSPYRRMSARSACLVLLISLAASAWLGLYLMLTFKYDADSWLTHPWGPLSRSHPPRRLYTAPLPRPKGEDAADAARAWTVPPPGGRGEPARPGQLRWTRAAYEHITSRIDALQMHARADADGQGGTDGGGGTAATCTAARLLLAPDHLAGLISKFHIFQGHLLLGLCLGRTVVPIPVEGPARGTRRFYEGCAGPMLTLECYLDRLAGCSLNEGKLPGMLERYPQLARGEYGNLVARDVGGGERPATLAGQGGGELGTDPGTVQGPIVDGWLGGRLHFGGVGMGGFGRVGGLVEPGRLWSAGMTQVPPIGWDQRIHVIRVARGQSLASLLAQLRSPAVERHAAVMVIGLHTVSDVQGSMGHLARCALPQEDWRRLWDRGDVYVGEKREERPTRRKNRRLEEITPSDWPRGQGPPSAPSATPAAASTGMDTGGGRQAPDGASRSEPSLGYPDREGSDSSSDDGSSEEGEWDGEASAGEWEEATLGDESRYFMVRAVITHHLFRPSARSLVIAARLAEVFQEVLGASLTEDADCLSQGADCSSKGADCLSENADCLTEPGADEEGGNTHEARSSVDPNASVAGREEDAGAKGGLGPVDNLLRVDREGQLDGDMAARDDGEPSPSPGPWHRGSHGPGRRGGPWALSTPQSSGAPVGGGVDASSMASVGDALSQGLGSRFTTPSDGTTGAASMAGTAGTRCHGRSDEGGGVRRPIAPPVVFVGIHIRATDKLAAEDPYGQRHKHGRPLAQYLCAAEGYLQGVLADMLEGANTTTTTAAAATARTRQATARAAT
eukprot:jgi/Mesvir1/23685/Mv18639-RA.1